MMRINGQLDSDESSGTEIDEMAEHENSLLMEKIEELEKKILDQGDEIICLRSTLANVVRRLEQVEAASKGASESWSKYGNSGTKNGGNRSSIEYGVLRQPGFGFNSKAKEPLKKSLSTTNSGLLHRRQTHYQSTGSLHSGQSNNSEPNSSNSGSPVPVSPSASTHSGLQAALRTPGTPNSYIPSKAGDGGKGNSQSLSSSKAASNLHNSKRWSSTGDFAIHTQIPSPSQSTPFSRSSTKSLLNLFPRHQPSASYMSLSTHAKRGTSEIVLDENEGLLRMYLRGRPIVVNIPTAVLDTYDVNELVKPPTERLKLDWVYGYRGRDCRSNLYFLPTGEMVYFIAAVVVLYNVEEQSQRHYLGHTDDVKCLAIHPNKMVVATGQCAGHDIRRDSKPHIRVWNSVSLQTLAILGLNEFEKSICCISFSKVDGGALLCAIDESMDHTITVWDWQKKERNGKLTENKCSVDTVIAAEFHPLDRHCIVTCGKSHIAFWILDQNGTLYKRMGIFENRDKPKYVTCLAFTQDGDTLSGDSNGNIIVWGRGTNTITKLIRGVHDSAIFSICPLKDGVIITGGGKDGKLVMLNSEFLPIDEGYIGEQFGGIRQVSESRGSQLLIGTTKNSILIGSFAVGFSPVTIGHTEEIWGCAPHPNLPQFLTAGFDGILHLWDSLAHSLVWTKDVGEPIQSVRFSPDGSIVIVGLLNGKWCVLDCGKREILCTYQDGSEPIQDCKFSPDKTSLALGSRDNTIYIYQTSPDFTNYHKVGRCVGHSSFIKHIDWSTDSQYIRSNSGDYELLYWQASICRQVTQTSSLKDVEWASNDCTITFNTLGIWQDGMDGTDINKCSRSNNCKLLVTGDDFGKLKLYTYPVNHPKSLFHTAGGHSSHVTNVEFLNDDSRILSVGGKDTSVMQWKVC